jgi:MFS superfamily sulfate permease-like transporter
MKLTQDLKSGLIVSLIALPLCLGISIASGAPLLTGIIAGIVGGIVVGLISDSPLSVSGPAAGLSVIIYFGIQEVGGFAAFIPAIILAGLLQIVFGQLKFGKFTSFIPHSVIEGMLASIGILIIIKQIPLLLGLTNYSEVQNLMLGQNVGSSMGALAIGLGCLFSFIIFRITRIKTWRVFRIIPFPLFLVIFSALIAHFLIQTDFALLSRDFVQIARALKSLHFADHFTALREATWFSPLILKHAAVLAIVASIETLLCIEASIKLDPLKRGTNKDRELLAQGIGNFTSGLMGGLPVTSVIVRTSANLEAGATSKWSTVFHGTILLIGLLLFPNLIDMIPVAVLGAILIFTGYNLAAPQKFIQSFKQGLLEFIPFFATILGVVMLDLLKGVILGLVVALVLKKFAKNSRHSL